jgi:shikimate kinase
VIVLVGFMGAGKSHVGRILATRLKLPFWDVDPIIEERTGRRIAEIFATDGEPAFRDLEHATIAELLRGPRGVMAAGGGAAIDPRTQALLRTTAVTVHLRVSLIQSLSRVGADPGRPVLGRPDLPQVYAWRSPVYASLADISVDTDDRTQDTIVKEIIRQLELLSEGDT